MSGKGYITLNVDIVVLQNWNGIGQKGAEPENSMGRFDEHAVDKVVILPDVDYVSTWDS